MQTVFGILSPSKYSGVKVALMEPPPNLSQEPILGFLKVELQDLASLTTASLFLWPTTFARIFEKDENNMMEAVTLRVIVTEFGFL